MSLITENKARRLLKDYMDAELKGDDSKAEEIENKLNEAGWKISVGAEGYTVIRENGGLFSTDNIGSSNTVLPNPQYTPYNGTAKTGSSNVGLIIGISAGALVLIVTIILIVRAYKQSKYVVSG